MHNVYKPVRRFQPFTASLARYLAAGIEVESKAYGRGALVGLPYIQLGAVAIADVILEFPGEDAVSSGMYQLSSIRPILFSPDDRAQVVAQLASSQRHGGHFGLVSTDVDDLERMARIVDTARGLGIALNITESEYVRKEVQGA